MPLPNEDRKDADRHANTGGAPSDGDPSSAQHRSPNGKQPGTWDDGDDGDTNAGGRRAWRAVRRIGCGCVTVVVLLLALVGGAYALFGGNATVTPPAIAEDERAAEVAILDYGDHASVLFSMDDGGSVEFTFGDHAWYALGQQSVGDAIAACVIETQGTLGQRNVARSVREERRRFESGDTVFVDMALVTVRRAPMVALRDELLRAHRTAGEARGVVENQAYRFVKVATPYTLWDNCNHRVVDWLERMGCDVSGWIVLAEFTVASADERGGTEKTIE